MYSSFTGVVLWMHPVCWCAPVPVVVKHQYCYSAHRSLAYVRGLALSTPLGVFGFCALRVLLTAWILLPSYSVRPLCRLLAVAFAMLDMLVFCVWVRFFVLLSSGALRVVV
jgi:hypothetical protein